MNTLLKSMKEVSNYKFTENSALSYASTLDPLLDLFGLGGAYRTRSDEDCIVLFNKAYAVDPLHALKCLFYLRDCRGGQGERRFFRVVLHWLAKSHPEAACRNLENISFYGRYDDLFCLMDTPLENDALSFIRHQLALDVECKTPSLLAKWMPSENTSSEKTRALAAKVRRYLHMTSRQYRKTLSILRQRINVLERLMSAGKWSEIEFDSIPSKAGLIYRNAFARHDIERAIKGAKTYEDFAKDKDTKVNADTLYPCDVVHKATEIYCKARLDDTERLMVNKYWDSLKDVFNGASFNGVAVVDTSGSMTWGQGPIHPIDVAIALGMYCAEKCSPSSPWHGHYISFSRRARLVEIQGADFVDKVQRIYRTNLCEDTNLESVFQLILSLAVKNHIKQEELPQSIVVISDMELNAALDYGCRWNQTMMDRMAEKFAEYGYKIPRLVFWNVNARSDNFAMKDNGGVTYVSGYSPVLFQQVLSGKTGADFVLDKLDSERYARIK